MTGDGRLRVVRCRVRVVMHPESSGGLTHSLALPTQSIVFKFDDGALAGSSVVAIVQSDEVEVLTAGTEADAVVTFPDAPPGEGFNERPFTLWLGREVGTAFTTDSDERQST
ncbi:MAG TPA: hypothetical protein VIC82_14260 [Candidatus Nanopelagicales bacterium]